MIKQKFGDRLDGWIHTAFPFLFYRPLNPNLLTVIGALGSIAAAAAFARRRLGIASFPIRVRAGQADEQ